MYSYPSEYMLYMYSIDVTSCNIDIVFIQTYIIIHNFECFSYKFHFILLIQFTYCLHCITYIYVYIYMYMYMLYVLLHIHYYI